MDRDPDPYDKHHNRDHHRRSNKDFRDSKRGLGSRPDTARHHRRSQSPRPSSYHISGDQSKVSTSNDIPVWQSPPAPLSSLAVVPPPPQYDTRKFSTDALDKLNLPQDENGIIPTAPYYELPAGLMVPLIGADELEYRPLDSSNLRLPFPKFPDSNFLRLIDDYYSPNPKTRDNDGWDRSFIDTYLKQKQALAEMKRTVY